MGGGGSGVGSKIPFLFPGIPAKDASPHCVPGTVLGPWHISVSCLNTPMMPACHFTVEKAEVQRGEVICPRPPNQEGVTLRFKSYLPEVKAASSARAAPHPTPSRCWLYSLRTPLGERDRTHHSHSSPGWCSQRGACHTYQKADGSSESSIGKGESLSTISWKTIRS